MDMRSFFISVLAGALLAAAPAAAETNQFYSRYFGKHGNVCYARHYDAAHLAQHPRQKVQQIALAFSPGRTQTAAAFEVKLGIVAKGSARRFSSPASCTSREDGVVCKVEGDGGTFELRSRGAGMMLQVVGDGLRMEGTTFFEAGGAASDDNLFALPPAAWSQCRVARGP